MAAKDVSISGSALAPVVEEMRPRSLERYDAAEVREIASFTARFPNRHEVLARLPVPDQEAIRADGVTFCWCPIDEAIREALQATGGNKLAASRLLGISRATLYEKLAS